MNIAGRGVLLSLIASIAAGDEGRFVEAAMYSEKHDGLSLLVLRGGQVVFEAYHNGHGADTAHRLASGTKSFSGAMAAAAVDDGIISFDEVVSDTITEWKSDPRKAKITVRHLLSLTSGLDPATDSLQGPGVENKYAHAVGVEAKYEPGSRFEYGPAAYFAWGEFMRRKLDGRGETPYEYLKRRILAPIGLKPTRWTTDRAGNHQWPAGAFLTAREWAKFGELIRRRGTWNGKAIVSWESLGQCFKGSAANPAYGLTFWLNAPVDETLLAEGALEQRLRQRSGARSISPAAPPDLVMAAGAGKQRLYIIPSLDAVIVRQGEGRTFQDDEFLPLVLKALAKADTQ